MAEAQSDGASCPQDYQVTHKQAHSAPKSACPPILSICCIYDATCLYIPYHTIPYNICPYVSIYIISQHTSQLLITTVLRSTSTCVQTIFCGMLFLQILDIEWECSAMLPQHHLSHLTALTKLGAQLHLTRSCILPRSLVKLDVKDMTEVSRLMSLQNLQVC